MLPDREYFFLSSDVEKTSPFGRFSHAYRLLRIERAIFVFMSTISIGFAICSFMPASLQRATSSAKAFAVIAIIGTVFASARSEYLV